MGHSLQPPLIPFAHVILVQHDISPGSLWPWARTGLWPWHLATSGLQIWHPSEVIFVFTVNILKLVPGVGPRCTQDIEIPSRSLAISWAGSHGIHPQVFANVFIILNVQEKATVLCVVVPVLSSAPLIQAVRQFPCLLITAAVGPVTLLVHALARCSVDPLA